MTQHYITKCSCGAIISQCRCPAPDKTVTVIERGCARCHVPVTVERRDKGWSIAIPDGGIFVLSDDAMKYVMERVHDYHHGED